MCVCLGCHLCANFNKNDMLLLDEVSKMTKVNTVPSFVDVGRGHVQYGDSA